MNADNERRFKISIQIIAGIIIPFGTSISEHFSYRQVITLIQVVFNFLVQYADVWAICFIVVLMIIAGIILFILKMKATIFYGACEISVGAYASYNAFSYIYYGGNIAPVTILQILTGLYVIVRGLDNINKRLNWIT
jgi:hypothetical protein